MGWVDFIRAYFLVGMCGFNSTQINCWVENDLSSNSKWNKPECGFIDRPYPFLKGGPKKIYGPSN